MTKFLFNKFFSLSALILFAASGSVACAASKDARPSPSGDVPPEGTQVALGSPATNASTTPSATVASTGTAAVTGLAASSTAKGAAKDSAAKDPPITVPTITLEGDANGAPHPQPSAYAARFSGKYTHRTIEGGVGHNLPQEAPQAFTDAVIEVDGFAS
jgi:pimeloyl-ACP methyl ester carboxylesterase